MVSSGRKLPQFLSLSLAIGAGWTVVSGLCQCTDCLSYTLALSPPASGRESGDDTRESALSASHLSSSLGLSFPAASPASSLQSSAAPLGSTGACARRRDGRGKRQEEAGQRRSLLGAPAASSGQQWATSAKRRRQQVVRVELCGVRTTARPKQQTRTGAKRSIVCALACAVLVKSTVTFLCCAGQIFITVFLADSVRADACQRPTGRRCLVARTTHCDSSIAAGAGRPLALVHCYWAASALLQCTVHATHTVARTGELQMGQSRRTLLRQTEAFRRGPPSARRRGQSLAEGEPKRGGQRAAKEEQKAAKEDFLFATMAKRATRRGRFLWPARARPSTRPHPQPDLI